MKKNFHVEIVELLQMSDLSEEDRTLWLALLDAQTDVVQAVFLSIFTEERDLLPNITKNLRLKMRAKNDPSQETAIFEQEKHIFEKIFEASSHNSEEK